MILCFLGSLNLLKLLHGQFGDSTSALLKKRMWDIYIFIPTVFYSGINIVLNFFKHHAKAIRHRCTCWGGRGGDRPPKFFLAGMPMLLDVLCCETVYA